MTKEREKQKLKELLKDHRRYASKLLKIRTKAGTLEPLIYNEAQEELERVWKELEVKGKPIRILVLKARRLGISTYTQSKGFHFASTKMYRHVKIVAHEVEATETLFEISQTFYDEMPETVELSDGSKAQIRPRTKYSSKKELVFSDLKSQITLKTAGKDTESKQSSGVGRSQTVHFLHCSEVAFWPAAKNTLVSLLQTVPNLPGTVVILESTANGIGDHFYVLVQQIINGESDYVLVFLPWQMFREYRIPLEPGETLEPYTEEELQLIEQYHVDDEQLKWRRYTIRNECQGDIEQFHQEYPSSVEEAFLVTGRPYFDRKAIVDIKNRHQREPLRRGYLKEIDGIVQLIDDPKGYVSIWKEPQSKRNYVVGADVAEGLEKGDYSDADVIDRNTFEQVAQWHGHIDAELFGEECVLLARYYNEAWLGIEVNNHGLTTNKAAAKTGYKKLFERQILDERYSDYTDKLGWKTTTQTRPVMLDELQTLIREKTIIIHSQGTINECLTFVRNDKGKPEAAGDSFDDRVIALAIANQVHQLCPMDSAKREKTEEEKYLESLPKGSAEYQVKKHMAEVMNKKLRKKEMDVSKVIK